MAIVTLNIKKSINNINSNFKGNSALMKRLGITQYIQIDDRFENSEFSQEKKWKDLTEETLRRRKNKNGAQILIDTALLRGSFSPFMEAPGKKQKISDFKIATSSDVPYMDMHQFGFRGLVVVPAHIRKQKKRIGQKIKTVTKTIKYKTKKGKSVSYKKKVKVKTKGRLVLSDVKVKSFKRFIIVPQRKILGFTKQNMKEFNEVIIDFFSGG